ncbi:quinolinate synthase NadA [Pseudenhygromyxa sp. WMMC2535]|uniref:quinolinate synthase NadA n=1 Tax=Pseudenhygromyxa sp. WMMC2535 TaxID=2712867 RepID=UPI001554D700|nr:quinolinate synthase NadA [Pseudenhygromyxa sp. WMMC2535]NVB38802.1 quinolinate synthase NadA [Pseudenhygromyxa sp. WMMC2535]
MSTRSEPFPSLIIRADGVEAQGAFAEAQAEYLDPDAGVVSRLERLLSSRSAGVVAHFYMDPELQGVLYACDWPHIHVSDSLVMADRACDMAKAGAQEIVVLGVDFMSENVRAMLDASGHEDVGCWRVSERPIGCSLAESAEALAYGAWLDKAMATPKSLHVVYINTSLRTKARAHHKVPTITCTSSNVVATVLQTFAQEPDAHVWFGPDTYMGQNLARLFATLLELDDEAIRALHPAHDRETIRALLPRFHYFEQGNCVVHHLFGADVARRVEDDYYRAAAEPGATAVDVTAHLEVPGEMFALALRAQREGRGVIGSTKNILDHIGARLDAALDEGAAPHGPTRLRFVLGTEAGMITAIARSIRARLAEAPAAREVEVEIIFPVASEAVTATGDAAMPLVPGVSGGEGCSTAGGCATCPYMKMNSLDALVDLLERLPSSAGPGEPREGVEQAHEALAGFRPEAYTETIAGRTMAQLGTLPILHMRGFQRGGELPEALIADIRAR